MFLLDMGVTGKHYGAGAAVSGGSGGSSGASPSSSSSRPAGRGGKKSKKSNTHSTPAPSSSSSSTAKHTATPASEAKNAAKEKKTQQDEIESLQITFYEIESWIEKTTPVLARMTKELDKASQHFGKRRKENDGNPSVHPISSIEPVQQQQPQQQPPALHYQNPHQQQIQQQQQQALLQQQQQQQELQKKECENAMQWTLSFQPGNSLRLETNITSIEQLVEAVRKISGLAEPTSLDNPNTNTNTNTNTPATAAFYSSLSSSSSSSSSTAISSISAVSSSILHENSHDDADDFEDEPQQLHISGVSFWIDPLETDPSTEYWQIAIGRRPETCLEQYKHCEMNLSRLTEDVSPSVLNYICQVYWDCLHPKFSCDWYTFWDRSGDPKRNQVCIDSGLAIVFLHVIRHDKKACANALDIAYYYYDRARESLMEFFDTPDTATLETLMNLAMFCTVCKRHSQARIYISLAFRMMLEMGMHQRCKLPADRVLRKKYLKLFMVLYYNDVSTSIYSSDPEQVMDSEHDIDFYEIIELNKVLKANGEGGCDDNMVVKETYFCHLMELARIGKHARRLVREYHNYQQHHAQHHHPRPHTNEIPARWARRIQPIEQALFAWFDRLPDYYRVDPAPFDTPSTPTSVPSEPHPMAPEVLQDHAGLLLMLQYQTQWILVHKPFLSPAHTSSPATPPLDSPSLASPTLPTSPCGSQRADRSHAICTDAANRIVIISELITAKYGWCVCQQFIISIYHASTIFCRNALLKDDDMMRRHAKRMIYRIIRVLASTSINYHGLPDDLTACLNDFLVDHGMQALPSSSTALGDATSGLQLDTGEEADDEAALAVLNQFFARVSDNDLPPLAFNDTLANSPNYHRSHSPMVKGEACAAQDAMSWR
ncbi:hypothetical protein BCR43DRAFT_109959 [Syncephalastrum racemosum]|uniref:Xylanolytic transcriptional activator regulatory domain-containing protein n=1 Tax=Syncephalastrum racemosum TaxID=13706 RepID=A0A1X2GZV7_SYNRA|nr:hypothetical protein BCR43DRAFT_109959 [Syncephalastrum racemosum]